MGNKSITQIIFLIISVAMIFTYINPTFIAIKDIQDESLQYASAVENASEYNQRLRNLIATSNQFNESDKDALRAYLPTEHDEVSIMADLATISFSAGLGVNEIVSGEVVMSNSDVVFQGEKIEQTGTSYQDFSMNVSGTYDQFKELLAILEKNKYMLEVVSAQFGSFSLDTQEIVSSLDALEGEYQLTLRTYAFSGLTN